MQEGVKTIKEDIKNKNLFKKDALQTIKDNLEQNPIEYEKFKEDNPHLERYFNTEGLAGLGDGMRMSVPGIGQAHMAFETGVIQRMQETIPGNTMAGHKTKRIREWWSYIKE